MSTSVIYSDLDGSLLDHDTYSHAPADDLLSALEEAGIPVIPCTSKTRAEVLPLRTELHNRHPFVFENGAAVAVPHDYFKHKPEGSRSKGEFWIRAFTLPHEHWRSLLRNAAPDFSPDFRGFSDMSDAEIAALTGLSDAQARLARQREFGEPIHWQADSERLEAFIRQLQQAGAVILRGGRFVHVSGRSDKGQALQWLNSQYTLQAQGKAPVSIAAGDSQNDVAMLDAADRAVLIRSPAHPFPDMERTENLYCTQATGPQGWVEGIKHFLPTL